MTRVHQPSPNLWNARLSAAGLPADWPPRDSRAHPLAAQLRSDLGELEEARATIDGFARQLGASFDTIETLYSIGREMRDVSQPTHFFELVTGRLFSVLAFEWLGLVFLDSPDCPEAFRGRSRFSAAPSVETGDIADRLRERMSNAPLREGVVLGDGSINPGQSVLQPLVIKDRTVGCLAAGQKYGADPLVSSYDTQLLEASAGFVSSFCDNVVLYDEQRQMFMGTVKALTAAIDAKDRYTCGHSERVAFLAGQLAERVGLSDAEVELVRLAGIVHDVGKIGVPEAVLTKAGKLTEAEFDLIRQHPEIGYRILGGIPPLAPVLPAVLHHHERFDGKGYPHGLSAESIPLFARIVSIADTFDAMSSSRSYRPAMSRSRVLREMAASAGSQLDPTLVLTFVLMDFAGYDALMRGDHASRGLAA
ncbi:MAG: HD-GYP domain-containing protein [Phycisphaerales bacterium]